MELSRGAMNILTNVLQGNEWYGGIKYAFVAGDILANILPEPEQIPECVGLNTDPGKVREWLRMRHKVDLEKKAIYAKVCKAAINFNIEKKKLMPSPYLSELITALGMEPQDADE